MTRKLDLVVSRKDLHAAGVGDAAIAGRVARGELVRTYRGAFLNGPSRQERLERALLALKLIKARGVVTGAECLRVLGHAVKERYDVVDVVVPHGVPVPVLAGVEFRRSSYLPPATGRPQDAGSLAPVAWALGDFARDASDGQLAGVIARGVGAGVWDLDRLDREALRDHRYPGRARMRRVLAALRSDLPFSGTEKRAAAALRRAGFEVVLQHRVVGASGRTYLLDIADVEAQHDIELDGPHHQLPEQVVIDRRRDRDLRSTDRWTTERFSVYEVDADTDRFAEEAGRAIRAKRRALRRLRGAA